MIVETKYGFSLRVGDGSYIGAQIKQYGVWEQAETERVRQLIRPGDLTVDAGAHVGYYSCLMAKCGARVLAFEPNPKLHTLLVQNCQEWHWPSVAAHQLALSDVDGEADFYLPSGYDDGFGSLGAADRDDRSHSIRVQTRRLDGFLPLGRIRLVKIDVEGAEALVIRGLGASFTDVDYFLIECIDRARRLELLGSSVAVINALLAGFRIYEFAASGGWKQVSEAHSSAGPSVLFENPVVK
jgi:FkbM family methyltransferase